MTAFDPWTATLAQALTQSDPYKPQGAVFQTVAANKVTTNKEKIVAGKGFDVLEAVADCAMHGLVMPDWLAMEYLKRYRVVQQCRVDSWDAEESFCRPYQKGVQISALRRKRNNRIKVVLAVYDAIRKNPNRPIDVGFWEDVGQAAGEGKTSAQELYAQHVRYQHGLPVSKLKNRK